MHIVHDVDAPMQATLAAKPWSNRNGTQGYNGMHVELFACTDLPGNHLEVRPEVFEGENEQIHIHGDAAYLKGLLREWLAQLEDVEAGYREEFGPLSAAKCPDCQPGDVQPNVSHLVTCPQHVNYDLFRREAETGVSDDE